MGLLHLPCTNRLGGECGSRHPDRHWHHIGECRQVCCDLMTANDGSTFLRDEQGHEGEGTYFDKVGAAHWDSQAQNAPQCLDVWRTEYESKLFVKRGVMNKPEANAKVDPHDDSS